VSQRNKVQPIRNSLHASGLGTSRTKDTTACTSHTNEERDYVMVPVVKRELRCASTEGRVTSDDVVFGEQKKEKGAKTPIHGR
jgi:hypothetical protein